MPKIKKAHKEKIKTAIDLCEKRFYSFIARMEEVDKENAAILKTFLISNTFFAGGVFRSTFTNNKVNDIDIFFKSEKAVVQFLHYIRMAPKIASLFTVTSNATFIFASPNDEPDVAFITKNPGDVNDTMQRFDFSFNQHYYDMSEFKMNFNVDTFNKIGVVNTGSPTLKENCISIFLRAVRFASEGIYITEHSVRDLVHFVVNYERKKTLSNIKGLISSSGGFVPEDRFVTGNVYTETDYLDIKPSKVKRNTKGSVGGIITPSDGHTITTPNIISTHSDSYEYLINAIPSTYGGGLGSDNSNSVRGYIPPSDIERASRRAEDQVIRNRIQEREMYSQQQVSFYSTGRPVYPTILDDLLRS